MFDTHCHLNFSAFSKTLDLVIRNARQAGVQSFVVPGTDIETSKKAREIAEKNEDIYAAIGIHPHHVYEYAVQREAYNVQEEIKKIEELVRHRKVVAVGEIGIDRHYYQKTKYPGYRIDESFIQLQKEILLRQIELAVHYRKTLILHNREAKEDLLSILSSQLSIFDAIPVVFHCCEPDQELLDFAVEHKIFIGVDGDVTYCKEKQEFVKKIPLEMLVLETDSPYLLPEPLRSRRLYPNEPRNVSLIANKIAQIKRIPVNQLTGATTENAEKLFSTI